MQMKISLLLNKPSQLFPNNLKNFHYGLVGADLLLENISLLRYKNVIRFKTVHFNQVEF